MAVTTEVLTLGLSGLSVGDWAEIKGCYVHALARKEDEKGEGRLQSIAMVLLSNIPNPQNGIQRSKKDKITFSKRKALSLFLSPEVSESGIIHFLCIIGGFIFLSLPTTIMSTIRVTVSSPDLISTLLLISSKRQCQMTNGQSLRKSNMCPSPSFLHS